MDKVVEKQDLDRLYRITGAGIKVIWISILGYMVVSALLIYFIRAEPGRIIIGAVILIAISHFMWLYFVLRAARKLKKYR